MKIQYLSAIGIILAGCIMSISTHAENYVVRTEAQGGSGKEAEMARLIQDMDKTAAAKKDRLAMANVANACLEAGDYACAYENILLSLTSSYWWQWEVPNHVLVIHDRARDGLSDEEAEKITANVKAFIAGEAKKARKTMKDDMANKDPSEWETEARKGKILAAGHLAKKYLEEKDYSNAYIWSTIASMGLSWQMLGESMLSYRDQARKHMNAEQIKKADEDMNTIVRQIHYQGMTPEQIEEMEKLMKELKKQ